MILKSNFPMVQTFNQLTTDYGRPMKPFFIEIPNFCAWTENWADKFWFFRPNYQHPFCYCQSLVHASHNIQPLFLPKSKPSQPLNCDCDLNLGRKELGIQPVCPQSVQLSIERGQIDTEFYIQHNWLKLFLKERSYLFAILQLHIVRASRKKDLDFQIF